MKADDLCPFALPSDFAARAANVRRRMENGELADGVQDYPTIANFLGMPVEFFMVVTEMGVAMASRREVTISPRPIFGMRPPHEAEDAQTYAAVASALGMTPEFVILAARMSVGLMDDMTVILTPMPDGSLRGELARPRAN